MNDNNVDINPGWVYVLNNIDDEGLLLLMDERHIGVNQEGYIVIHDIPPTLPIYLRVSTELITRIKRLIRDKNISKILQ